MEEVQKIRQNCVDHDGKSGGKREDQKIKNKKIKNKGKVKKQWITEGVKRKRNIMKCTF